MTRAVAWQLSRPARNGASAVVRTNDVWTPCISHVYQHLQAAVAPARYFAGDWGLLGQLLFSLGLAHSFDVVVSAETIYTTESMTALLTCIKQASC